jgi:hypothetical protein
MHVHRTNKRNEILTFKDFWTDPISKLIINLSFLRASAPPKSHTSRQDQISQNKRTTKQNKTKATKYAEMMIDFFKIYRRMGCEIFKSLLLSGRRI